MPCPTPDFDRRELMLAGGCALAAGAAPARAADLASPIVELRQYTLHGGRRYELSPTARSALA